MGHDLNLQLTEPLKVVSDGLLVQRRAGDDTGGADTCQDDVAEGIRSSNGCPNVPVQTVAHQSQGNDFPLGRPIDLRASDKADAVGSKGPVAHEIPQLHGGGDVKLSEEVSVGHLTEEEESEINIGEPLTLSPPSF